MSTELQTVYDKDATALEIDKDGNFVPTGDIIDDTIIPPGTQIPSGEVTAEEKVNLNEI